MDVLYVVVMGVARVVRLSIYMALIVGALVLGGHVDNEKQYDMGNLCIKDALTGDVRCWYPVDGAAK